MTAFVRRARPYAFAALAVLVGALALSVFVPQVLAFPHRTQIGDVTVYSVEPPGPALTTIVARAQALTAASEIATPLGPRAIYLTDGGWRWRILSVPNSYGAFALTRPFTTNIVINRSDIAADTAYNGSIVGGDRSLSGTIAHETTHLLINRRYGLAAIGFARWKVEGYCDHVARESNLSPAEAEQFRRAGSTSPALFYFDARRRVAAALAGGASVDALMRGD